MGKKGPYIERDVYVEGETVKIWGTIENPIENYGEIWSDVFMSLWFECPGQMYRKCYYPYWPTRGKSTAIDWKFRPGEKYPYEGGFEFKFKASMVKCLNSDKPCDVSSAQKWRAILWYGPLPLNWYRDICEKGGSWSEFVKHPRCLGMLEWTVTESITPPPTPPPPPPSPPEPPPEVPAPPPEKPKVGYLLPLAAIPVAAVSAIVVFQEASKRK